MKVVEHQILSGKVVSQASMGQKWPEYEQKQFTTYRLEKDKN